MGMTKQSKRFLLVFFSEEDQNQESSNRKSNNLNQFSSSPSFTRTNSSQIIHKAQSTISICLLLFTSLLLFTLSTLPSATSPQIQSPSNLSHALQRMGTLYRRGTRAMTDLVVAHAAESLTQTELRLFLRLFHRSPLASKSDLLIIFPSNSAAHDAAILEENDSFLQSSNVSLSSPSFDVKEIAEPIWGRKNRSNSTGAAESTRLSYGSVVGFDVEELDPENLLSGFLDHVPMSLRRWACYPMLLGRVRRNFKHVMIVDAREFLVLGDPLGRVRTQGAESVLVSKHGKRTHPVRVHSGVLMGGSRGIRRVCSKMLTDIVRASMQQQHKKKKNSVADAVLFDQLVQNDHFLKQVTLMVSTESMPELSSLGSKSGWHNLLKSNNSHGLIRVGNPNLDVNSLIMKQLCLFAVDSTVYSDSQ